MPELPEVEAARRDLLRWLRGSALLGARALDRRVAGTGSAGRLEAALRGARVRNIARRGKYLIWDLAPRGRDLPRRLLSHLGMTGKFVRRRRGEPDPSFVRLRLELSSGGRVYYCDPRRFGGFFLPGKGLEKRLGRLGIEPLSRAFTPGRLGELLARSRRAVKTVLLDQSRVAGLGNIYAAESLFLARIDPSRSSGSLRAGEVRRLHGAILRSLRETIRAQKGREVVYLGERSAPNPFRVYDRKGEPCPRCRKAIERFAQAGRSTYWCPACQG